MTILVIVYSFYHYNKDYEGHNHLYQPSNAGAESAKYKMEIDPERTDLKWYEKLIVKYARSKQKKEEKKAIEQNNKQKELDRQKNTRPEAYLKEDSGIANNEDKKHENEFDSDEDQDYEAEIDKVGNKNSALHHRTGNDKVKENKAADDDERLDKIENKGAKEGSEF